MSARRNSKRNSLSATDGEPASKRHKPDDPSSVPLILGDHRDEHGEPRAPDLSDEAIAKLPEKERSCLVDLPYPDQVERYIRWRGKLP